MYRHICTYQSVSVADMQCIHMCICTYVSCVNNVCNTCIDKCIYVYAYMACIYKYIVYLYIDINIWICMYAHIYAYTYTHTYSCPCVCTHRLCINPHTHMYLYKSIHTQVYIWTCCCAAGGSGAAHPLYLWHRIRIAGSTHSVPYTRHAVAIGKHLMQKICHCAERCDPQWINPIYSTSISCYSLFYCTSQRVSPLERLESLIY